MHYLISILLVAFLPFATGEKCKTHGGQCDQICSGDTVPGAINDCAGSQYCCVKKEASGPGVETPPEEEKAPAATEAPAGTESAAPAENPEGKEHFTEAILVCSPLHHKYVESDRGILVCNSERTSLRLLYKDGFRLIQIVEGDNKALYYLEKK